MKEEKKYSGKLALEISFTCRACGILATKAAGYWLEEGTKICPICGSAFSAEEARRHHATTVAKLKGLGAIR